MTEKNDNLRRLTEQWLACELRNGKWTRKISTPFGVEIQESLSWDDMAKITIGLLWPYIQVSGEMEETIARAYETAISMMNGLTKDTKAQR